MSLSSSLVRTDFLYLGGGLAVNFGEDHPEWRMTMRDEPSFWEDQGRIDSRGHEPVLNMLGFDTVKYPFLLDELTIDVIAPMPPDLLLALRESLNDLLDGDVIAVDPAVIASVHDRVHAFHH